MLAFNFIRAWQVDQIDACGNRLLQRISSAQKGHPDVINIQNGIKTECVEYLTKAWFLMVVKRVFIIEVERVFLFDIFEKNPGGADNESTDI